MSVAVRYYTKKGNTKRLAEAMAEELGVTAESIEVPLTSQVDRLFLCNSVYWAGIDGDVKRFVTDNAGKIGELVNVGTAAIIGSTFEQMKKVAEHAGVTLSDKEFHCRGQFTAMHMGHPNNEDLQAARAFARSLA